MELRARHLVRPGPGAASGTVPERARDRVPFRGDGGHDEHTHEKSLRGQEGAGEG
ncbi:hypothetical protein GCM10010433_04650 [Streptomyces pulveraceus]